jgi:hypothetical protein
LDRSRGKRIAWVGVDPHSWISRRLELSRPKGSHGPATIHARIRSGRLQVALFLLTILFFLGIPLASHSRTADRIPALLVQILVAPKQYTGRQANVVGFLTGGPEIRLFLTQDHAEVRDLESSLEVEAATLIGSNCANKYVRVIGTVANVNTIWRIVDVVRISQLETFEVCWPLRQPG